MKRSKPKRLLTPAQMTELVEVVYKRDNGCRGKVWPYHKCGGFRNGGMFEAHHVIEQSVIKQLYGARGGKVVADHIEPITRYEFCEVAVTADEVAKDSNLCICLCCDLHSAWPTLPRAMQLALIDRPVIAAAAKRYSLPCDLLEDSE